MALYKQIYETLRERLSSGVYRERLPSEQQLRTEFGASRPTIARAVQRLEAEGLVDRQVGAGTFVRMKPAHPSDNNRFGLLIPNQANTDFFPLICEAIQLALPQNCALSIWGSPGDVADIRQLSAKLTAERVAGVFFVPLELTPNSDRINAEIAASLKERGIATVLIDRNIGPYSQGVEMDLVGIDNERAGYVITEHLVEHGCGSWAFFHRPNSAPTVDARIVGFRAALSAHGIHCGPAQPLGSEPPGRHRKSATRGTKSTAAHIHSGDPTDRVSVEILLTSLGRGRTASARSPLGVVCANDSTAAELMKTLEDLGVGVPEDVRLVGIDDMKYAALLRVPLTTLKQPCIEIAKAAVEALLERRRQPNRAPREIHLNFELIRRRSCGCPGQETGAAK